MNKPGFKPQTGPVKQKLPPQSLEAEESLISAVLLDNNTLLDILEIVSAEDFYKGVHKKIFAAITELSSEGEPIDLVTLADRLKAMGKLDAVGGAAFLTRIVDTAPFAANPKHYARIIHDKAVLRQLINAANGIVSKCFDETGSLDDVIDSAEASLSDIADHKGKQNLRHIGDIIYTTALEIEKRKGNNGRLSGVTSGFTRLDELTSGFQGSDLIILAARPGMGKTALALNIARNAAVNANVPVAVFSLEMSRQQLTTRMLCSESRTSSTKVRDGFFNDEEWEHLSNAMGVLTQTPIYIDDSSELSSLDIKTKARRMKREKGLGLIIIDYLQLMKPRVAMERRDLEISEMSRSLKGLAKELNVPIIALSQLNRRLEERSDKHPQLSDLRESGALEQDADLVIFIYRDEQYNKEEDNPERGMAEIEIAKHRNGPSGKVKLVFLGEYTRFEELTLQGYSPQSPKSI